jgi:glycosyltransferase involved in cell wall biosynthesis
MWPTPGNPQSGAFVRDQVEALSRIEDLEIELARFPVGAPNYLRAGRKLWRRAARGRFDVVHAHYGLSGWSALSSAAPSLVVTFHGTDLRHPVAGPLSRLLARAVTLPAAVSASLARDRLAGAGRKRRVAVLPCGVDVRRFRRLDRREARVRLGLDPDRPHILFPADPQRAIKRHDRAQALARRLPEAMLISLRATPPEEVPLWINASNAVLVTSDQEGFGLAALEALACDVPVLSTPVGIAPVALTGIAGALSAPYDEERWLGVLRAHVQAPDPRVPGRPRALMFSSERMAARVAAAYRALASLETRA